MVVPTEAPVCSSSLTEPPDSTIRKARSVSFMRVVMTSSETAAILGTASPRNPKEVMEKISSIELILLVP